MTPSGLPDDPARELRQLVAAGRFRDALEARRRSADAEHPVAEVDLLAATAATRLGDLSAGADLARSALQRFQARADADGRMRSFNLLGAIAFDRGQLEEAEACFARALEDARTLDDPRMTANTSNNLASVAHLQAHEEVAFSMYRTALLAYQRLGDRRGAAQSCHNLALAFRQQGNWMDAEAAAQQAIRHAEAVGEPGLKGLVLMGRVELHLEMGETAFAGRELTRAESLVREAGDETGLAEAIRLRALLALREGDLDGALAHALEAREAAARVGATQLEGESLAAAALAARRLGQPAKAEAHRLAALAIFKRLGATRLARQLDDAYASGGGA
ncbi:MAG: tetratricopeptide repeat protein [Gemmatimonadota bacterium]|nr:tetratricopeptide repeat protein [Gemmatimonadota bacterium]MDH4347163.1 tetratricopeptide repeat protein [Gemmatimonadota bacterium]MDH5284874.1 tetratricopeptide repeat protein [Gemmatimonadota bacterium]